MAASSPAEDSLRAQIDTLRSEHKRQRDAAKAQLADAYARIEALELENAALRAEGPGAAPAVPPPVRKEAEDGPDDGMVFLDSRAVACTWVEPPAGAPRVTFATGGPAGAELVGCLTGEVFARGGAAAGWTRLARPASGALRAPVAAASVVGGDGGAGLAVVAADVAGGVCVWAADGSGCWGAEEGSLTLPRCAALPWGACGPAVVVGDAGELGVFDPASGAWSWARMCLPGGRGIEEVSAALVLGPDGAAGRADALLAVAGRGVDGIAYAPLPAGPCAGGCLEVTPRALSGCSAPVLDMAVCAGGALAVSFAGDVVEAVALTDHSVVWHATGHQTLETTKTLPRVVGTPDGGAMVTSSFPGEPLRGVMVLGREEGAERVEGTGSGRGVLSLGPRDFPGRVVLGAAVDGGVCRLVA